MSPNDDRAKSTPDNVVELHRTPASLEAERIVLGAAMVCPDVLSEPDVDEVEPEDFYSDKHGALWTLLLEMHDRGDTIDPTAVLDRVEATGRAEEVGGYGYVVGLPDEVPSIESAGYYARIVRQRSTLRIVRRKAMELVEASTKGDIDLAELQVQADRVSRVAELRSTGQEWQTAGDVAEALYEDIEGRAARGGDDPGLPCGVLSDLVIARPTQMWVIAGRPGMGKTGFVLEWMYRLAEQGIGTAMVSAEMPPNDLMVRRACLLADVPIQRAQSGEVNGAELARIRDACAHISELPQWFTDAPGLTIQSVRSRLYAVMRKAERQGTPVQMVFIDHVGKLRGQPRQSEYDRITEISGELSSFALRTGLVVGALSQLNREVEKRPMKRPQLSDLRSSGALEQDARGVLMLYRPEYYDEDTANKGMGEVICGKQNGGPTGSRWLPFINQFGTYDMGRTAQPFGASTWGQA